ncbi:MAG: SGNH/GDSL hydrolase family protein [Candidatus Saccharimonadales bacterium]
MKRNIMIVFSSILVIFIVFVIAELVYIATNGDPVPAPEIDRSVRTSGSGPKLTYVVMGDSTTISQGSDYEDGYAVSSAEHLAQTYTVSFSNVGISGATSQSVVDEQLADAIERKPDLVLLGVGANDTTHFTSGKSIQSSLQHIIDSLHEANPEVRIVVTRSPAMDSVTRFPWGAKQFMALRTRQVNKAFAEIIEKNNLTLAPIAEKTRDAFIADPTLTAVDNFHPNARGYALWKPVIDDALDEALSK